jgi:hypothetical protein
MPQNRFSAKKQRNEAKVQRENHAWEDTQQNQ